MIATSLFFPVTSLRFPEPARSVAEAEQRFYEIHGEPVPQWVLWFVKTVKRTGLATSGASRIKRLAQSRGNRRMVERCPD